jgi:hypothetical protein
MSTNHIKIGASAINSISAGDFSMGVSGGADYGPTSETGFYNGITPPVGGYTIYVNKASQGPSIHVPRTDGECLLYLNKYGANASNISDALTWASIQTNILVRTSEYTVGDLSGGGTSVKISNNQMFDPICSTTTTLLVNVSSGTSLSDALTITGDFASLGAYYTPADPGNMMQYPPIFKIAYLVDGVLKNRQFKLTSVGIASGSDVMFGLTQEFTCS